ncbi:Protein of unknown function, partial [Gryllus bimaculatus]
ARWAPPLPRELPLRRPPRAHPAPRRTRPSCRTLAAAHSRTTPPGARRQRPQAAAVAARVAVRRRRGARRRRLRRRRLRAQRAQHQPVGALRPRPPQAHVHQRPPPADPARRHRQRHPRPERPHDLAPAVGEQDASEDTGVEEWHVKQLLARRFGDSLFFDERMVRHPSTHLCPRVAGGGSAGPRREQDERRAATRRACRGRKKRGKKKRRCRQGEPESELCSAARRRARP